MSTPINFVLTDTTQTVGNITLYQIRAIKDNPAQGILSGDLGGWVESSHLHDGSPRISDNAWVFDYAWVYGNARVSGDAWVFGKAQVSGNARISGNAWVAGSAQVFGGAQVFGSAQVRRNAQVFGGAQVSGSAQVRGNAQVFDSAQVFGSAQISGGARVYGDAQVADNARVFDIARIYGSARVFGDARVSGDACVSGGARVHGVAAIERGWHCLSVGPIGSEDSTATLYRTEGDGHRLDVGCWTGGTLDTLLAEVERRREHWTADAATQELWVQQYEALHALGTATVTRWTTHNDNKEN